MDNITVGYTFDRVASFRSFRLFGTVQNVFTLTPYKGVDPEAAVLSANATSTFIPSVGIDNNIYPRARTYLLGAGITF
jgi:iron complex outermembrane receptor protein